jgi:nicotinamidase-related amidase
MPDLRTLLDPGRTAVVTMELQRGVVGDLAFMPAIAEVAREGDVIANAAAIVQAARRAGARVVHCTAEYRPGRVGASTNAPLLRSLAKGEPHMIAGTPEVELVPELGPDPSDVVCPRTHGLSPFPGTDLDQLLRNLGVQALVVTGVSMNVGVVGLVIVAADLGYDVVVATDAVAGMPTEYADAVLRHTIPAVATPATSAEIVQGWS